MSDYLFLNDVLETIFRAKLDKNAKARYRQRIRRGLPHLTIGKARIPFGKGRQGQMADTIRKVDVPELLEYFRNFDGQFLNSPSEVANKLPVSAAPVVKMPKPPLAPVERLGNGQQFVYVWHSTADAKGIYNIGSSKTSGESRIKSKMTGRPGDPVYDLEIRCEDCEALERHFHNILKYRGKEVKEEVFRTNLDEVKSIFNFLVHKD